MRAHVDAVSTVARACNATAWVLGVYHAHSWMLGHFAPQAQQDVYGNGGNEAVAAVIGPRGKAVRRGDGTYRLSGFWPFASGNAAAHWLLLGCEVFDESGNKLDDGDLLVPMSDVRVLDDWHVAGLQGTGSSSVKCSDITASISFAVGTTRKPHRALYGSWRAGPVQVAGRPGTGALHCQFSRGCGARRAG